MTSNPDALLPSAKEVMQKIALAEAEEAEKQARMRAEAQAEKKALIEQLSKPSGISDDEAIRRGRRRLIEDCHWITQKITRSLSNDRSLASS